jgi:hypothetical protein
MDYENWVKSLDSRFDYARDKENRKVFLSEMGYEYLPKEKMVKTPLGRVFSRNTAEEILTNLKIGDSEQIEALHALELIMLNLDSSKFYRLTDN